MRKIYKDVHDEAQRIIRISDEIRISLEKVEKEEIEHEEEDNEKDSADTTKLSTSRCAKKFKMDTKEFLETLVKKGYLEIKEDKHYLTALGKDIGGEFKFSKKFGSYFIWPEDLAI